MRLEQATQKDFEAIIAFYDDVTERTPDMAVYARWIKGKHPTQESIRTYIDEGSMYLYREEGGIVGAMAVTMYQGEDYHAIEWARQVGNDEAAVIHTLAVSPDRQGEGIGSEMIREAIHLAQANGMKAVRLDALASNTPAHRIYECLGFVQRGQQHLYAENTGWTDFDFFDLCISAVWYAEWQ
jgi:ribosomal protein S18 acetylase RimI-like enzyme